MILIMKVRPDDIKNIRQSVPIEPMLVDLGFTPKRSGQGWMICCPYHDDRNPSCSVIEGGFFRCFACGVKGDVIELVRHVRQLSFIDAIDYLARLAGVSLVERKSVDQAVLDEAARYYEWCFHNTKGGETARNYLRKRGWRDSAMQTWRVGYAPNGRGLIDKVREKFGERGLDALIANKLAYRNDNGELMLSLVSRVVFPLWRGGDVAGFTGRALREDEQPKYKHAFRGSRSNMLVQPPPKEKADVVLVEGVMDAEAFARHGWYAVACLGCEVPSAALQSIAHKAKSWTICFDGDKAGQQATIKSLRAVLSVAHNVPVFVMQLPDGRDPADIATDLPKLRQKAVPAHRFLAEFLPRPASEVECAKEVAHWQAACCDLGHATLIGDVLRERWGLPLADVAQHFARRTRIAARQAVVDGVFHPEWRDEQVQAAIEKIDNEHLHFILLAARGVALSREVIKSLQAIDAEGFLPVSPHELLALYARLEDGKRR